MSLTSDELNYLIWRYFQEAGLQTSALALLDESTVADFNDRYGTYVPIGSLVNLVQKGLLYAQADQLVQPNGQVIDDDQFREKMTLFHALGVDAAINGTQEVTERFQRANGNNDNAGENGNTRPPHTGGDDVDMDRQGSPAFIKVLQKQTGLGEPTTTMQVHPVSSVLLAYGLSDSRAKIRNLGNNDNTVTLSHPQQAFGDTTTPTGDITTLAWSPNGELLLTGVESGELRLWNTEGMLKNVMLLHQAPVLMIRWSPNGSHILTTDSASLSVVWDSTTGSVVQNIDIVKPVETTEATQLGQSSEFTTLGVDSTWIDDSRFVIPGLDGSALVFQIGDRTPVGKLVGHTKPLSAIHFNRSKQLLLTASDDRSIRIWNGANFNSTHILLGHSQPITFADWIDDNFVISCGLDATVRVWETIYGTQLSLATTDSIPILNACLSRDKKRIAVGTTEGVVTIFEILVNNREVKLSTLAVSQPEVPQGEDENYVTSLEWSLDDKCVLVGYSHAESLMFRVAL